MAEDAPVTAAATPGGAVPDHTLVPRKARSGAWSNLSGTTWLVSTGCRIRPATGLPVAALPPLACFSGVSWHLTSRVR